MKRWLAKKIYNLVRSYENDTQDVECKKSTVIDSSSSRQLEDHIHNPINFSVYSAQGGRVVEVRQRDQRTERWDTSLHVIKSDEDFGAEIANIIFMETLKRGS